MNSGVGYLLYPSLPRKRKMHFEATFEGAFELGQNSLRRCDTICLRMSPRRMQLLN